jgi:hypothetical protein
MIPMRALGYQNYKGAWYRMGDTMLVENEADAADMVATHMAERMPQVAQHSVEPQNRQIGAEEIEPVNTEVTAAAAEKKTKSRQKRYPHREMRSSR